MTAFQDQVSCETEGTYESLQSPTLSD